MERNGMRRLGLLASLVVLLLGAPAGVTRAADAPITGLKLIVVDKLAAANKAKAVFVSRDTAVTKGAGTDPAQIGARLDVAFDSLNGTFLMPPGSNWLVNSPTVSKYVNKTAPTGGAVKVGIIKPGTLVKVVAKSLGDTPLNISSAPTGNVYVANTVMNGGDESRLCTQFAACVRTVIAGGTGYKLTCTGSSTGDPVCTAAGPPTTTTITSSTTTTTICVATSGTFCDPGDGTVHDSATGLVWEQKTTTVGSGANAADLHDVDNLYRWAGTCSGAVPTKLCQPNLAAETACKAQTDAAFWTNGCEQCVGAEGNCTVSPAIATVWDWLTQVNAANYAGHSDWRMPSESGCNSCWTGPMPSGPTGNCTSCSAHELETILLSLYPCGTSPCIDPIFGPTASYFYWSDATNANPMANNPAFGWTVSFLNGSATFDLKVDLENVRAVRGSPAPSTTTTTTSSTTTTTICVATSGTLCDLGDGTVYDSATGLQWEKKSTTAGLNLWNDSYSWAGSCSVATSKLCQPNQAAETACKAQTDAVYWTRGCEQCTAGEGTCTPGFGNTTTVWDWVSQLNAAGFAGHTDWRLPSESGCNSCFASGSCTSCDAHELETILLGSYPCPTVECIDPIFGPTAAFLTWSASTYAPDPREAWYVHFLYAFVDRIYKEYPNYVRAVRGAP